MIYGYAIREQNEFKFATEIEIMQEYYENEISFLNDIIKYQNESSICESTELEVLQEGFVETFKEKVKSIVDKFIKFIQDSWNFITVILKKAIDVLKKKYDEAITALKRNTDSGDIRKLARGCSLGLKITDKKYIITRYDEDFNKNLFSSSIFDREIQNLDDVMRVFINALVSNGENVDIQNLREYKKSNEQLLRNVRIVTVDDKLNIKEKMKNKTVDYDYNDEETLKQAIISFYKTDNYLIKELEVMHTNFINFAKHVKGGMGKVKENLNKVKNWEDIESLNLLYSIINTEINKCSLIYNHGAYLCNTGIKLLQYRDHNSDNRPE